jgi:hypothetical protein
MTASIGFTAAATARSRANLGLHHLLAACRNSAAISKLESEHAGKEFGSHWDEILQNSLGVAMLATAALESYANELYFEGAALKGVVNSTAVERLAELVNRESVLNKYALALAIRNGKRLDFDSEPVQSAAALVRLRNAVVHFRPEWSGEEDEHAKLSNKLVSKFDPSPFLQNEKHLFPIAWASASFSSWAMRSTVAFLEHFYQLADIPSPLEKFKSRLCGVSGIAL